MSPNHLQWLLHGLRGRLEGKSGGIHFAYHSGTYILNNTKLAIFFIFILTLYNSCLHLLQCILNIYSIFLTCLQSMLFRGWIWMRKIWRFIFKTQLQIQNKSFKYMAYWVVGILKFRNGMRVGRNFMINRAISYS